MSKEPFPNLAGFLGSYFHQDWPLESVTSAEVVLKYRSKASAAAVKRIADEVSALREEKSTETQLKKRLQGMGCYFEPASESTTFREWLGWLEQALLSKRSRNVK